MPQFTSKAPYIKQISIYLKNESYTQALSLTKEFTEAFPEYMMAHFLYAKSAFWANKLETADNVSSRAFNLSRGQDELAVAGILRACTLFRLKRYPEGMKLLKLLNTKLKQKEEIEKLEFIFALALKDEKEALTHLKALYKINKESASSFIAQVLSKYI